MLKSLLELVVLGGGRFGGELFFGTKESQFCYWHFVLASFGVWEVHYY